MPSPFPGMDPFVEAQEWGDFHTTFNTVMREMLAAELRPAYTVRVERRVYVEHPPDQTVESQLRVADVAIGESLPRSGKHLGTGESVSTLEPVKCEVAIVEERREAFLVIRDVEHQRIVTVIETLSPTNKRRGGDGWTSYLSKREEVLASQSHLVELDLLRGGTRMPVVPRSQRPIGDYRAMVSRVESRPCVDVYAWSLLRALPTIAIPLIEHDEQVDIDLQQTFAVVYDRAGYDLMLNYSADLDPPLADDVKEWLRERLPQTPDA